MEKSPWGLSTFTKVTPPVNSKYTDISGHRCILPCMESCVCNDTALQALGHEIKDVCVALSKK